MKIPSEFYLFGSKWMVIFDNDNLDNNKNYGECRSTERVIAIASKSHGRQRTDDAIGETFYHELIHAILDSSEYNKLSENENLVSLMGKLLYQFELTKK